MVTVIVVQSAKDLLRHLLVRDPKKRLGSGEQDADEIKAHAFFHDLDWMALASGTLPPPWTPSVAGSLDTSQFDAEFTSMIPTGNDCFFSQLVVIYIMNLQ